MPHKRGHTWKDAFGGKLINKAKLNIKKSWQSDSNPIQAVRNQAAGIGDPSKGAGGRIQKDLVEKKGFSKTELRNTGDAHKAWKKAKSQGREALKKWERKYHPDRIKAGKSRYGNKSGNKHKDRPRRGY